MKISVCYIQYNRIECLLKSLRLLERQTYDNIEVVISDDASTDNTEQEISLLKENYKFPLVYSRLDSNCGYDRNYRRCIELASGDYCFVLGNDDAIVGDDSLLHLVEFLKKNNFPSIGFTNYFEFSEPNKITERAKITGVLGTGLDVALRHYNSFSFVGGLIYKRKVFNKFNSGIHDGSIYAQMYFGMVMILAGESLFSIKEAIVAKDITFNEIKPFSFRDNLIRKWGDFKVVDGGLPSVIRVISSAIDMSGKGSSTNYLTVFYKIYLRTFSYWIMEYKKNKAKPSAIGLILGMYPGKNQDLYRLNYYDKIKIYILYIFVSFFAFIIPYELFFRFADNLYKLNR